jgi:undecaprenyl diphosphate synthase
MYLKPPSHVGVILDGNRRWAKVRGLQPWAGHREGAKTLDNFLHWCMELGIKQVSVYSLSKENLNRPKKELEEIFEIFYEYIKKWERGESDFLTKYEVKVRFVGDLSRLPPKLVRLMGKLMEKTAKYQKRVLNLLVSYSGHFELKEALKRVVEKVLKNGTVEITEKDIEKNLLVSDPVQLIIRTGGYNRLSNFLLWQSAYAEVYTTKVLWPDFTKKELIKAIRWFNSVQRNFGK